MALPDTLTTKIGGQPVYVWVGGGVVIIGGFVWYRKRKGATSQGTDTISYDQAVSDGFSMPTGSAGGGGAGQTLGGAVAGQPGGTGSTAPVPTPTGTQPDNSKSSASPKSAAKAAKEFPAGTVLRQGSRGGLVKALQRMLNAAGFNPGNVDGIYGSQTFRAVKAYQRSRGLATDGVAGSETLGALMANRAPAVNQTRPTTMQPTVRTRV